MKKLFIGLLLTVLAQSTFAADISLDEAGSKKMYKILAEWGARMNDATNKRTYESVKDVLCGKDTSDNYACRLHDNLHNTDPAISGPIAKALFLEVQTYNGALCSISSGNCSTATAAIKCIHYWNPKDNDLRRSYICVLAGRETSAL